MNCSDKGDGWLMKLNNTFFIVLICLEFPFGDYLHLKCQKSKFHFLLIQNIKILHYYFKFSNFIVNIIIHFQFPSIVRRISLNYRSNLILN